MKKGAVNKRKKLDWAKIILALIASVVIVLLFTLVDYFTHSLSPSYSVPSYYFRDKIIFGTFWVLVAYYFVRKKEIFPRSLIISAFTAVVLQIRYYLIGYPLNFVLSFLVLHFIMLFISCLIVFTLMKKQLE